MGYVKKKCTRCGARKAVRFRQNSYEGFFHKFRCAVCGEWFD